MFFIPRSYKAPQHVMITGASSGIGAALAMHYARPGVILSLSGRNRERLVGIAEICANMKANVSIATIDVTQQSCMASWCNKQDELSPIDLVFANAGLGGHQSLAQDMSENADIANAIFATNIAGVVNTISPVTPLMLKRKRGQIVIMSSLASYIGLPDAPAYCASKAAVRIYGDGLRRLLAPSGITVTVVSPGFVATPMSASLPQKGPFEWSAEKAASYIATKLERRPKTIIFPWPLRMLIALERALPIAVSDFILSRTRL